MRIWFKLCASWTLVAAQIAAGLCAAAFASPPRGTTLCNRPPPYIGDASPITEATPFPGSTLFRPDDGGRHLSLILLHGSQGGSDPNLPGMRAFGPD